MATDRYRWVSAIYDMFATVGSLGAVDRCKRDSVADASPGERVLIAGAGHGHDAVEALRLGAQVTVVELSPSMCGHFRRQLMKAGLSDCERLRLVQGDILSFEVPPEDLYDRVIASFFLNIFGAEEMRTVLRHLIHVTRPGGRVIVGDFAGPTGSWLRRMVAHLNWSIVTVFFHAFAGDTRHGLYSLDETMRELGLELAAPRRFGLYWSLRGQR